MIVTYIFVYILEIREFFGNGLVNKVRDAYRIDVLEAVL